MESAAVHAWKSDYFVRSYNRQATVLASGARRAHRFRDRRYVCARSTFVAPRPGRCPQGQQLAPASRRASGARAHRADERGRAPSLYLGGCGGGIIGFDSSLTHAAKLKMRNSSAFSCAVSVADWQAPGMSPDGAPPA